MCNNLKQCALEPGSQIISTVLHVSDGSESKTQQIMETTAGYNKLTKQAGLPHCGCSGNRITAAVSLSIKTDGPVAPHCTRPRSHNSILQMLSILRLIFIYLTALKPHSTNKASMISQIYPSLVDFYLFIFCLKRKLYNFISILRKITDL